MQTIKLWQAATTMLVVAMGMDAVPALAANPALRADHVAVVQACAGDAQLAGCPTGRGELRCLRAFRDAHPGFRVSADCHGAKRQLKADRRALRPPPRY